MAKIIRIEKCSDCTFSTYDYGTYWCRKLQRHVNAFQIHPDCPLENAEEVKDEILLSHIIVNAR